MLDIGIHALSPFVNGVATKMIYDDRRLFKLEQMAMNVGKEGTIAKEEIAKIMSKNMFTDTTGTIWTYGEMRQLIQRKNIAFNNNSNVGMLDVRSEQTVEKIYAHNDSVLKKAYNNFNPIDGDNLIMSSAKHLSGAVEEQARIVNFIVNLKKTGDPMLAAQRTKMFLFDYGNLTRFERTIMKRIIPFYTFTRKNLELQAHMVMSQPGRIEAEITGVQTLGDAISGNQLTESEKKALPDWLRNGIILLKDKRGSTLSIISNLKTPIEQPFQAFQPNNLLGSISPLIKIPFEQMSGYSLYNGKMLSDVTNATAFKNAPKPLKDFIGFTERKGTYKDGTPYLWYESVRPERMNLFLNLGVTARTLGTLKQLERADASTGEKILNFMTGIRTNTIDLEKEQAKRDKDYVDRLTKLEQSVGIVGVTNKTFIPKNN